MTRWRIRATVADRPGFLAVLTASLALRAVNILSVRVHRDATGAVDDFLVEAPDALTRADLLAAVDKGRGRDAYVQRADPDALVEPEVFVLGLAGRLVRDPEELAAVLARALRDGEHCQVTWAPGPVPDGTAAGDLVLPDPGGGVLRVRRDAPPFTPAERAQAGALAELAATVVAERAGTAAVAAAAVTAGTGTPSPAR